jgi:ABC-type dipeptide/oligopeptide/nickel transport system permease subunit
VAFTNPVQNELHLPLCSVLRVLSCFSFLFAFQSATLFLASLAFLGMVVVADSPLLSTLVAQNAPEIKGTTLTIVNSIGFAITIISIQLISGLRTVTDTNTIIFV